MHTTLTSTPQSAAEEDTILGLQLTVEYQRAVGGMRSVLTFGGMMTLLRERLALPNANLAEGVHLNTKRHDGVCLPRGRQAKDGGIAGWLRRHAPSVEEPTARRLEQVAHGVALDYEKIVGARIAKQISFATLVTTPAEDLPEPLRAKQLDLFAFVEGTSQRSWLDKLRPISPRGGNHHPPCKACGKSLRNHASERCSHCGTPTGALPPDPNRDPQREDAIDLWTPLLRELQREGIDHKSFVHLPDKGPVSRETLKGLIIDLGAALRGCEREAQ